jgi:hypothetical protein
MRLEPASDESDAGCPELLAEDGGTELVGLDDDPLALRLERAPGHEQRGPYLAAPVVELLERRTRLAASTVRESPETAQVGRDPLGGARELSHLPVQLRLVRTEGRIQLVDSLLPRERVRQRLLGGRRLLAGPVQLVVAAPPARLESGETRRGPVEVGARNGGIVLGLTATTLDVLELERQALERVPHLYDTHANGGCALLEAANGLELTGDRVVSALELCRVGEQRVGRSGCHGDHCRRSGVRRLAP